MNHRVCLVLSLWAACQSVLLAQPPLVAPAAGVEVIPIESAVPLQRTQSAAAGPVSSAPFFDTAGLVLNANTSGLPQDCEAISGELAFTVRAGTRHVPADSTHTFAYDQPRLEAPPCSRVTVTLVNDDAVRHQWVLRGLPAALHPGGVFHLEANGGQQVTGTFILPGEAARYPVSCTLAGHATLGMQAVLTVGDAMPAPGWWPLPGWTTVAGEEAPLTSGGLLLVLAMALTSGSLLLTLPGPKE